MPTMYCSAEEIEAKRKIALEKLALKKNGSKLATSPFKSFRGSFKHKPYDKLQEKSPVVLEAVKKPVTAKLSLINVDRFVLELSSFSSEAVQIVKTINYGNYNPHTKNWDFRIDDHDILVDKLQSIVSIERIPNFVLNCVKKPKLNYSEIDLGRIDFELANALMPFQEEGVRFGIAQGGRCLIADEMGLGKTFQALGIANYYKTDWPVIIVTTTSTRHDWQQTILEYLPSAPIMKVQNMETGKEYIDDSLILILTHDNMKRNIEKIMQKNFGVLIIDESHVMKNFKTKYSKAASSLAKKAKRVILLSGTPALSRPNELYTQLSMIDDKFFGNFYEYSKRYCDGQQGNFGWDSSGKSNLQELEIILRLRFMLRRTKNEVLKSFPKKSQEVVDLNLNWNNLTEEDKNCLQSLTSQYQQQKNGRDRHAILLPFFSQTAKMKIPAVSSYILQTLQLKKKFLLFAHHQTMLDAISQLLENKNVKFIRIDGNTPASQRKKYVDEFQRNDDVLVALLSITAANSGITLTAAQLVIFAELHWNPSTLSQAESRAHRIGQVNPVCVKYLLARGTVDDVIWPMLQEKQKVLTGIGLSNETFINASLATECESISEHSKRSCDQTASGTNSILTYFKKVDQHKNSTCPEDRNHVGESSLNVTIEDKQRKTIEKIFDDGFNDIFSAMET